ncbi:exonuclease domain-containing protein [Streptomyces goshikiensis]|uniref:exonuclease domain-containing protein n=1 Tax=Streptomyces goshikiensis TaxID=1942 RepID=UPI0036A1E278
MTIEPMTRLGDVRRLAFDTETTGTDPHEARIVTAALAARGGGLPDTVTSWLINPGVPIPSEATAIHGVDNARAATGVDPAVALDEIADHLAQALLAGMPVIAFNLSFDWTVLAYELERHRLPSMGERMLDLTEPALLDPHVIDKQVDRYVKGSGMRKLKPTAERYGVELTDWHTAEADALAALLITEAQFERYPQLSAMEPGQLYTAQRAWRAEQQAGLQAWFRRADPSAEVRGEWPLIPRQKAGEER